MTRFDPRLPNPNAFAHNPLDRAGNRRRDEAWVAQMHRHPDAETLIVVDNEILITEDGSDIAWATMAIAEALPQSTPVLLGLEGEAPRFAVDASGGAQIIEGLGTFQGLRQAAPHLSPEALSIAGQAIWLLGWHRRHPFCTKDGDPTEMREGGLKRVNPRTGVEHFPRTDPVAIVLPICGDRVCLARSPHFPTGMMSAVAGFLEACETLEQCAAREVGEELGLTATQVAYRFSQPWPFPASLMMGFIATVTDEALTLDTVEIESARWFSREEAEVLVSGGRVDGAFAPPPFAIAHQLLRDWVRR